MDSYEALGKGIMEGDGSVVESEVRKALSSGAKPRQILEEGLIGAMNVIGKRFRDGDMFFPEVLMTADAMHKGLDIIKPLLEKSGENANGKVVIGTVEGDIHDIGKNIVKFLFEANGLEVVDIGVDVPASKFAGAVTKYQPDILALSCLLTTTMPQMENVINQLEKNGLRDKVKIIVGGAPLNEDFAKSIGADGYAPDACSAVELVKKLLTT